MTHVSLLVSLISTEYISFYLYIKVPSGITGRAVTRAGALGVAAVMQRPALKLTLNARGSLPLSVHVMNSPDVT